MRACVKITQRYVPVYSQNTKKLKKVPGKVTQIKVGREYGTARLC